MNVNILVSVPDPRYFDACTLVFDSLRVGFPTAKVEVWVNPFADELRVLEKAVPAECKISMLPRVVHHADWIRDRVIQAKGPLVILDSDVCFWKSCEDWKFDTQLAGYYVPEMFNDFAQCRSVERLHTSLLWFTDPPELVKRIKQVYPFSSLKNGDYCPCDPFMPAVRFIRGVPTFWDSCANLYHMVGGTAFGPGHLACFDHLNSSAFLELMAERLGHEGDAKLFRWLHTDGLMDLPKYKHLLWPTTERYYAKKAAQLRG